MKPLALLLPAALLVLGGPALGASARSAESLDRVRPSQDGSHFVLETSGKRFVVWGFNYDRDDSGRLIEDYWRDDWLAVVGDFREMKDLGANVVRVHLQLGRFMDAPDRPDDANLARLARLVTLAEDVGLYLDVTGLGCYHKQDVPDWYAKLDESSRWEVQARFWKAVAGACRRSPAIFCYDLMNEPIPVGNDPKGEWLPGPPLAGKYFVQRIAIEMRGRTDREIARSWVAKLSAAIRSVDDRAMITVGEIPWAQVFKGAKPLFQSPEVGGPLDFVSVHLYPKAGKLDDDLAALKVYELGKPLLIEEIFPISASFEETETFLDRSKAHADGWVTFYWGKTPREYESRGDMQGAIIAGWLERFRAMIAADGGRP